jgi:MFS family permease
VLGASVTAIGGVFGSAQALLDGLYQDPGGRIADRYGRRHARLLFVSLATLGYVIYWVAPSWPFVFGGLLRESP